MTQADFACRVLACERRLYRIAYTMLRNEADCEDAVQEALLRAWSRLGTLREEAYFETWLIRILINQCKTLYRRRPLDVELVNDSVMGSEDGHSPLLETLEDLPPKPRIAIELHYIEGYNVKECARILSVPEGTVKWRLHQGRRLLAQAMREEAEL